MSFGVKVDGGTGAGSKKPLLPANTIPWLCRCIAGGSFPWVPESAVFTLTDEDMFKRNPGYLVKCIDCGTQRP